ncbi:DUF4185 domain-containing protein [Janibacter anophelis]|uniref:DUF4185 domain-containing protein n=1 Tax=Janibacter anophelis TaxID=319054 RepID=UPI00082A69A2|nr:DUF4185 domain-containing protein [Janibacter anophelis]
MTRFLVNWLAGSLVVLGAWFGWTYTEQVEAAVSSAADLGPTPEGEPLRTEGTELGSPCAEPTPVDAAGMNALMDQLDGVPTLEGADHGDSVALADGRRMYAYGDTIRDTDVVEPFMVRNSVLVSNGACVKPMATEHDGPVIPSDGRLGYWPMSMRATEVEGGTVVQMITATVTVKGTDSFQTSGSNLAVFEVPTNRMPRLVSHEPIGERSTDPRVPTWGASMWDSGSWTYVFGTASNADKSTAGWALHVARSRPDDLGDPDAWQYWDGSSWVTGDRTAAQGEAAELISPHSGVSHVLGVLERDGSWYAVSKEGDYHGAWLSVWKADEVTGPWTKHRIRPLANDTKIRRYAPLVHPDFETASGRLLISWSEAPKKRAPFYTHPELYRPHFAEIELP